MKYSVAELAETFTRVLSELARALDAEAAPWMLVGGLAVGAWTEPRATKDCDIALALPPDVVALAATLRRAGAAVTAEQLAAFAFAHRFQRTVQARRPTRPAFRPTYPSLHSTP